MHTLVVVAGVLLFTLVFLAITGEAPQWPLSMALGSALVVAGLYWSFFQIFGGTSLGERMARLAGYAEEEIEEPAGPRFARVMPSAAATLPGVEYEAVAS